MMQGTLRALAAASLLIALAGCVDAAPAPLGASAATSASTSGATASTTPGQQGLSVSALSLSPASLDLNAPYSYGGNQSETEAGPSQQEVAGYPTSRRLSLLYTTSAGASGLGPDVWWDTSDPGLVTVDGGGLVRTVDPGTSGMAVITVHLKSNPQIMATASVTVRNDGKLSLELK